MDTQEVSAFAAYSAQKKSQKKDKSKSLKKKLKLKEKEKRKADENNISSVMNTSVDVPESTTSTSESPKKKNKKKHNDSTDLIKSILKAHRESIFKDCAAASEEDNVYLNDRGSESKNTGSKKLKKSVEDISMTKSKKIKYTNGDLEDSNTNSCSESSENSNYINGVTEIANKPASLFLGKSGVRNVGTGKRKNSSSERKDSKKSKESKKKNNGEHTDDSKNKTNQKNVTKKIQTETESRPVGVTKEPTEFREKSRLKKSEEASNLTKLIYSDSTKVGEEVFSWMLSPLCLEEFFKNCWEQKPVLIQHGNKEYFKQICTLEDFKRALRKHDMYFTRNIDVTSYVDGERHTENPEGKAKPAVVWDYYKSGRSIRLLNPQTFIHNVRVLNTVLQEFFHCFVGANIYLTPPGTQGFAPHYDDIEAFVLQLEGEKHWKLYNQKSQEEVLPRESSRNFREDEIGQPIMEARLQPGDLLYFPRGVIHQAKCLPHIHSLHITISCYQRNSWADLMEKVIPIALQKAISEDVEFRKGLPIGYLNCLGLSHSDQNSEQRRELIRKFDELVHKIIEYCPLDAAVDQLAADYIHDALPPCLTEVEELHGADRNGKLENGDFLQALYNSADRNLSVKLIRATCARLVAEEGELYLYYTTDNSLVYHEHEVLSVCISTQWAQAIECLIHSYPNFVEMRELPVSEKLNRPGKWKRIVECVYFLWQKGLLLFDQPLPQICS